MFTLQEIKAGLASFGKLLRKSDLPIDRLKLSSEKKWGEIEWCNYLNNIFFQGRVEVRMPDGTRCDIVTDQIAWEVDWANKWYECLGQALHYSRLTKLQAGMLLLVKSSDQEKYVRACIETLRDNDNLNVSILVYRIKDEPRLYPDTGLKSEAT